MLIWNITCLCFSVKSVHSSVARFEFVQTVYVPTPLKTNMSPENQWLEDVFPTEIVPFRGHSFVSGV